MVILFTFTSLVLLICGSIGLFVTYTNFAIGSVDWILGSVTHIPLVLMGLSIIIFLASTPIERD